MTYQIRYTINPVTFHVKIIFLAMHPLEIKETWWNEAVNNPKEESGKHSKKANKLGFKPKAANIIISNTES